MKNKFVKVFLVIHLIFVLVGSGLFAFSNKSLDKVVTCYSSWTGGGFGYGFFSPNVGNQVVIKVYTLRSNKQLQSDVFGTGEDIFESRLSSLTHTLINHKAFELMSRVIASYTFVKYPDSRVTHVSIGEYTPPSMKEYQNNNNNYLFDEKFNGTYLSE